MAKQQGSDNKNRFSQTEQERRFCQPDYYQQIGFRWSPQLTRIEKVRSRGRRCGMRPGWTKLQQPLPRSQGRRRVA